MVLVKKFSEFSNITPSNISDSNQKVVGLDDGANMQSTRFFTWTTAGRPPTPFNGLLGLNTSLQQYEYWDSVLADWVQLEDSGDLALLIARLAAHTIGDGASMIGLQNQSNVTNKTVQDLANASILTLTNNGSIQNGSVLQAGSGVTFTPGVGTLTISAAGSGGTVTSISQGLGITATPNPIIGVGTIALTNPLPLAIQNNITVLGVQAETLDMGTNLISNVVNPVSPQDAATKNYVDNTALNGTSVYAATIVNLPATQAGAGVGATLTDNSGTFAVFAIDGVNPPLGSNVLVKNYTNPANEGIYTLTTQGNGISIPWQLTRATSYDTSTEINNTGLIVILNGTQAGQAWYNTATIVTVDTTNFNFVRFGTTGTVTSITAGTGLTATPNPIITTGTIELTVPVSLANGGTNASLVASNGGIVYSNATQLQILAGTATADLPLLSNVNSAPEWGAFPISLGGALTTAGALTLVGAFGATFNFTGATNVTFPTSGTLATTTGNSTILNVQTITATGAFSYTPTTGTVAAIFEMQGAGGGSGGTTGTGGQSACSGAGGGGAYMRLLVTGASNLANITGSVGVGGTAGASGNNAGGTGGSTTLVINGGSTWTSAGGAGGNGLTSSASPQNAAASGAGGTNTTGTNGTLILNLPGSAGGRGYSAGNTTVGAFWCVGGASFLGRPQFANATAGLNYGGGASGIFISGSNQPGFAGAQGVVTILELIV